MTGTRESLSHTTVLNITSTFKMKKLTPEPQTLCTSRCHLSSRLRRLYSEAWAGPCCCCGRRWRPPCWLKQTHGYAPALFLLLFSSIIGEAVLLTVNENQDLYRKRSLIRYRVILACNVPVCAQTQPDWRGAARVSSCPVVLRGVKSQECRTEGGGAKTQIGRASCRERV